MKKFNNYKTNVRGTTVTLPEDYIVTCLHSALSYCKSQFETSDIDWLPTIDFVNPTLTEKDKYNLLCNFVAKLCLTDDLTNVQEEKEFSYGEYTYKHGVLTSHVTFNDDSQIYIFIESGMIFVADCDYDELSKRIDEDSDDYEAYDTTDGIAYYLNSDYADLISEALLYHFSNSIDNMNNG